MVIKYDKNSRVKLCQNKIILKTSDNFDRKVGNKTWSGQSVKSNFWSQIVVNFTGSPLVYEYFLGIMCHNLFYFAVLTYINEL